MESHTGFVHLYTGDIGAALGFYRDRLGFTETFRAPPEGAPEHVELALDGFSIGLGTVEAAWRVQDVRAVPGAPSMSLVVWCADADAAFVELMDAGVTVVQPPHPSANGNRAAMVRDPDGNLVELVSRAR